MKKILVNTPSLDLPGGVANHYKGLKPFWSYDVHYNFIGGRRGVPGPIVLLYDYFKFVLLLAFRRYDVVLLNPSLGNTAILRDSVFLRLSKLFRRRTIVFFHGWDVDQQRLIDSDPSSFLRKFRRADAFICLAKDFSARLRSWGISAPIYFASTKVDDGLVRNFDIDCKKYSCNLLFLARIEENKGILIALDAFLKVVAVNPKARFVVAGSGGALETAIAVVKSKSIPNVEFLGNVSGDALINAFSEADIYLLPTSHGEGMPTSVLEAMAFGLPVITRPVGGLKDFFENGKMGFISDSLDSQWYADAINKLFGDAERIRSIGRYNHNYAKENFMASKVAKRLEEFFERV